MKRLLFPILFSALLSAQTAKYPAAVATDADLKVAKNRIQTTLRGSVTAAQTSIVVASATGIVANQLLCIESEIVSVTSLVGTTLTVVRGFDGTTPAVHSTGRSVGNCVAAWYWTALSAEVQAIQSTLGPNMINVPGGGDVNGPAAGTGGEAAVLDATGRVLSRSAVTGVVKSAAGVQSAVTGTASHCVFVDGTSGFCNSSAADVVGPAAGTGGEISILDATGKILSRSNLTGVLKITAGVPSVVTGTGSYCVHVDGTSGACGTGSGDVVGPAAAVDSNFAGFDTTTGKLLKDSGSKAADFAVAAKGVTNGDTHNHVGGDGAAITEGAFSFTPASTTGNAIVGTHGLMPALTGGAGVVLSGAGTWIVIPGGGNVVGPAAGTGGELPTVDAGGTVLARSALTGVLKAAAGVPSVVTGTATDCIRVNGTSGACSGGVSAASDLTDFKVTISTTSVTNDTIGIAAGHARIGSYAPTTIALGQLIVTASDGGDLKVFIDENNNLVCHKETAGAITVTESGSIACSNVATPAYPANSIPLYDLAVDASEGVTIDSDDRAFLSSRGIAAGTGISIADAGGVATVGIDTATVPTLGAGSNDFTGAISALEVQLLNGSEGTCDAASAGRIVFVLGAGSTASTLKACGKNSSDVYAWVALTTWP